MEKKKVWWKSKTKVGAVLMGIGTILSTIGAMLTGNIDFTIGLAALGAQVGIVTTIWGIRDLPFINRK